MVFFTRKLCEGHQPDSGWENQALRTRRKLAEVYPDYRKAIESLLPKSVVELDRHGLHDARITSCSSKRGRLTIDLDATRIGSRWGGGLVTLRWRQELTSHGAASWPILVLFRDSFGIVNSLQPACPAR
jgi:hypothetical protein